MIDSIPAIAHKGGEEEKLGTFQGLIGDWLTQKETAWRLGICVETLRRWRRTHRGPPFYNMGAHYRLGPGVRYRRSEVDAWINGRRHES